MVPEHAHGSPRPTLFLDPHTPRGSLPHPLISVTMALLPRGPATHGLYPANCKLREKLTAGHRHSSKSNHGCVNTGLGPHYSRSSHLYPPARELRQMKGTQEPEGLACAEFQSETLPQHDGGKAPCLSRRWMTWAP